MRWRRFLLVLPSLLAIAVSGCVSRKYVYQPSTNTSATVAGRPASYDAIPRADPRGEVRVGTFGLADIRPADAGEDWNDGKREEAVRAIHLRMVVQNSSDASWSVDTRQQRVLLPREGESRAAFAAVAEGTLPVVEVPARSTRSIDLFYPLPEGMQQAKELPSFETVWQVRTEKELVVARTPFERLDVTPVAEPAPDGRYGWGSSYWAAPPYHHNPEYRGSGFGGMRLPPRYTEHPVSITHTPIEVPPIRPVR